MAEPERSALLAELLATELECRKNLGERPGLDEYRARFPDDAGLVDAAFVRIGLAPPPSKAEPERVAIDTGRNLLFGLLALQNNFISREVLLGAFNTWVVDKSRSLGDILRERRALDSTRNALLDALVAEHLKVHGGDSEKSLASLVVGGSTRDSLKRLGDTDLDASLSHAGTASNGNDEILTINTVGAFNDQGPRFRVLRPHAKGGLGAVYVALDHELKREVALKEILERHADDLVSRQRFVQEAEITGGLEHPGIVPVYGLGSYLDGRPYYAMRFIKGDSLKEAIAAFHNDPALKANSGSRSLALSKFLRRFLDICNAIDYAHSRGVLHRDIKPGNVIVGKYGETLVVDWGLAKSTGHRDADSDSDEQTFIPSSAGSNAETLPGAAIGTPAYMSPEQATGDLASLGAPSDVYGLGATLYHLLTGRPPVTTESVEATLKAVTAGEIPALRSIDPSIDRALEAICLKALAKRPEDRYSSVRALAEDIERWLADEPVNAWREPWVRTVTRWVNRNRTVVSTAVAALLVAMVGLGAVTAAQTQARNDLTLKNGELTRANLRLERERRRAEDREQQAIVAVKRFRDVVVDNPELKENPALKGLRDTLLKEPLVFFKTLRETLLADNDTRPESLAKLATACHELGSFTEEVGGNSQDALTAYSEALAIRQKLAEADPTNEQLQLDRASSQKRVASIRKLGGEGDASFERQSATQARHRDQTLEWLKSELDTWRALGDGPKF